MFQKLIRGYVEGLGSKTLAAIGAGVLALFLAPLAYKYLGVSADQTFDVLVGITSLVAIYAFKQWHLDVASGGKTSTQYLMTMKALQAAEAALPDGTKFDTMVREVIKAMQRESATKEEPPQTLPPEAPAA